MFVYVGAITAAYNEPKPPLYPRAGQITLLAIGSDGHLTLKERLALGAGATCINVHPSGRYLLAARPAPHCSSVHPLGQDGRVVPVSAPVQLHGRGVNTITLERPFPHSIKPDASGKRVLACDIGMDRVMVYDLDEQTGCLEPSLHPFAQLSSGSGARHLAIHGNNRWVYTVNELDSSVSAAAAICGTFTSWQATYCSPGERHHNCQS
jgi:6-phosphogluconolactonase